MTALVSLLFIAMIPIDCKIKNFSHICYKTEFGINCPLILSVGVGDHPCFLS